MGRKKINIEKIDNKKSRQVTFTKRRQGLFKKAADLCVLSDAKIGIVVFSATGNLFTFGHPSAEEVVNRFCNGTTPPTNDAAIQNSELVRSMRDTMSKIKFEKERLKKTKGDARGGFWWERVNFDELESMEELQDMENRLTNLRENVSNRINELESSRKLMDCAENRAPLLICNDAWNVPAAAADNSSHKCFANWDYFCPYWYGNPSSWPNLVNNNTLHGETLPIPGAYYYYR